MSDMTAGEIARAFAHNHREHEKFITKDLHDEVVKALRDDIQELKTAVNKLVWAIVGLAFTVVGAIIVNVAGRVGV